MIAVVIDSEYSHLRVIIWGIFFFISFISNTQHWQHSNSHGPSESSTPKLATPVSEPSRETKIQRWDDRVQNTHEDLLVVDFEAEAHPQSLNCDVDLLQD